jgi:hypothetical protein
MKFAGTRLKRWSVILAHRLCSGHFHSKRFAFLMKKTESPNCDVCGTLNDVQHILLEWKMFDAERVKLKCVLQQNSLNIGRLQSILAESGSNAALMLYDLASKYKCV